MNTKYMATILAFKDVASIPVVRIAMDTANEIAIIVYRNVDIIKFTECDDAFYSFDNDAPEIIPSQRTLEIMLLRQI